MQILLDHFGAFLLELSLSSQVTFSRFRSSFLSDLFSSHSEVKLVNIKSVAAKQKLWTNSTIGSANGYEAGGQWFESRRGQKSFHPPVVREQFFRH